MSEVSLELSSFLLDTPLYKEISLQGNNVFLSHLYHISREYKRFDGHCPACRDRTVYRIKSYPSAPSTVPIEKIYDRDSIKFYCGRNEDHEVVCHFLIQNGYIQKIGQYPSLADIATSEAQAYKGVLDKGNSSELYKAIGLAAHGVGIGSFVYLRRVFEHLIDARFNEYKEQENWDEIVFYKSRMDEKVDIMKSHLPDFLVGNTKIYSILSKGIHDLSEEECLGFFDILKHSIFFILDEDKKKKEELDMKTRIEDAIAKFGTK